MASHDQGRKNSKKSSESKLNKDQKIILPTPPKTSKPDSLNNTHRPKPTALALNDFRNKFNAQNRRNSIESLDEDLKLILSREDSNENENHSMDSGLPSSRPTSSSLSKYTALPSIGTKLNLNKELMIGLRLPDGKKIQCTFLNSNKAEKVLDFGINELKKSNNFAKKTNYVLVKWPNLVLSDLNKSIEFHKIENKDLLLVIEKRSLTENSRNH